jgi:hypothetical protein
MSAQVAQIVINGRSGVKIFCIGLNKTGTTSLGEALMALGFRHLGHRGRLMRAWIEGDMAPIFKAADRHDSFDDWPWPLIYRQLFERYEQAKFILTRRHSAEAWVESLKGHAERTDPDGNPRRAIFGHDYPHGREPEHIAFYDAHNAGVRAFFRERDAQDQLVELCWEEGHGWPDLCAFVERSTPDTPFPHISPADAPARNPAFVAENRRRIAKLTGAEDGR